MKDAVSVAPHMHSIIFENEKIRILKVIVRPGDTAEMHSHPENINYFLKGGKLIFTNLEGTKKEVEFEDEQITFSETNSHIVENKSNAEVRTIQIEFKK